ncbi:hypothetical protein [Nitrosovibrio sp. Nv4]|uniref:hypothetical protein n=1 Tax=Nitrosovibrio sp. Nv4 TaxID=1945880 RepID=UPI000BD67514|nr:hypothetical protein [Nitrosovibrio sp. Nv4]SOD42781.1 hypothetical protein SAMN06298226_3149 [Nitrosovibrio sp. Nv4]
MHLTIRRFLGLILITVFVVPPSFSGSDKEITVFDEVCLQDIVRKCAEDIHVGTPASWRLLVKDKEPPLTMTRPLPDNPAYQQWIVQWRSALCPAGYNKPAPNDECLPTVETKQTAYQYCYYKVRAEIPSACVRVLRPEVIAESSSKDMRLLLNQFCKTYAEKKEKCDEVLPPAVEKK